MGLIDNSGDILTDAVLTDIGRERLARADGSFEIVRYAFGDDEIDYSFFDPTGTTLQQDVSILNTPVFEAYVDEKIALKYQLISISNPDLKFLPTFEADVASISVGESSESSVGKTLKFSQKTTSGRIVPSEIVDPSFLIQVNNDLLFVEKQTPVNISENEIAQYIVPKTAVGSNQGAQVSFNVSVQSLTSDIWDTLGSGTSPSRTISTKVKCIGALSGLSAEVTITINEEFNR